MDAEQASLATAEAWLVMKVLKLVVAVVPHSPLEDWAPGEMTGPVVSTMLYDAV